MKKVCNECIHVRYCKQSFSNLVKYAKVYTKVRRGKEGFVLVSSECPLYPKHKKPEAKHWSVS